MAIPSGAVRGVLFDYGNVIGSIDHDDLARRIQGAGGAGDAQATRGVLAAGYRAHDAAITAGASHDVAWRAMIATLVRAGWGSDRTAPAATPPDVAAAVDTLVETLWEDQPTRNLWRAVSDEARELLADLQAADVPMAVVSNSEGRARETLAEVGVARFFVEIVDSGAVGVSKPDPAIFALAAEALGVPPAALVHVGDSESADVVGAHAAGAYAIRFDGLVPNAGTPTAADARADSYEELRGLLADALGVAL